MARKSIRNLTDDDLLEFEKNNHDDVNRFKREIDSGKDDIETEAEYIATLLTHQKIIKEWNRRSKPGSPKIFRKFKI